jgi:hypothetical protein
MSIIGAIYEFIQENCPCLDKFYQGIGVDFLDGRGGPYYSVESSVTEPIIKRYIGGSSVRQEQFIFSSTDAYGEDVRQNIANLGFFEDFAAWLEECNRQKTFPDLGVGRTVERIEALTTGYAYQTGVHEAKYQIQCRIKYFQES